MAGGKFHLMWIIFGLYALVFLSMGQDANPNVSIGIYKCGWVFILNRIFNVFVFLASVILQEPQQIDLNTIFNGIFSAIGSSEQMKFNVNFVQIDRNNVDETLTNCKHSFKVKTKFFKEKRRSSLKKYIFCF